MTAPDETPPAPPAVHTIRWDQWRPEYPAWRYDDATPADRYGDGR